MVALLAFAAVGLGINNENPGGAPSDVKQSLSFRLRLKPAKDPKAGEEHAVDADALAKAVEVLGKRLSAAKVGTALLIPQPPDQILMRCEGLTPAQVAIARKCVVQTAVLDFRMVHGESDLLLPKIEAKTAELDPAWVILPMKEIRAGEERPRRLIVQRVPEITGEGVAEAGAYYDTSGWLLKITFTKEAGVKFFEITRKMRKHVDRFAMVLDGQILSAPTTAVEGGIAGGSVQLAGRFTEQETKDLAAALMNPLRNPVVIEEESVK